MSTSRRMMMGSKISIPEDGGMAIFDFSSDFINSTDKMNLSRHVVSLQFGTDLSNFGKTNEWSRYDRDNGLISGMPNLTELDMSNRHIGSLSINNCRSLSNIDCSNSTIDWILPVNSMYDDCSSTFRYPNINTDSININLENTNILGYSHYGVSSTNMTDHALVGIYSSESSGVNPTEDLKLSINMNNCNWYPYPGYNYSANTGSTYPEVNQRNILFLSGWRSRISELYVKLPNFLSQNDQYSEDLTTLFAVSSTTTLAKKITIEAPDSGYAIPLSLYKYATDDNSVVGYISGISIYMIGKFNVPTGGYILRIYDYEDDYGDYMTCNGTIYYDNTSTKTLLQNAINDDVIYGTWKLVKI